VRHVRINNAFLTAAVISVVRAMDSHVVCKVVIRVWNRGASFLPLQLRDRVVKALDHLSPNSGDILAVSLQKPVAHEQRGFTFAPIQGEGDPAALWPLL
jgi:hypothetical protein